MNIVKRIKRKIQGRMSRVRSKVVTRMLFFKMGPACRSSFDQGKLVEVNPSTAANLPYKAEKVRRMLSCGHRLFAFEVDGHFVSFAWVKLNARTYFVKELRFLYDSRDITTGWIVSCETPEQFRGKGYYPALLRKIAEKFIENPFVIYCEVGNSASRSGILKAGFIQTEERRLWCWEYVTGHYREQFA